MRGASRKPIARGVEPRRVARARRAISARRPGLARRGQRAQALAHEAAVLAAQRHDVGDRGERDEVEVLVGGAGSAPGAASSACASLYATPAAHRSGHG